MYERDLIKFRDVPYGLIQEKFRANFECEGYWERKDGAARHKTARVFYNIDSIINLIESNKSMNELDLQLTHYFMSDLLTIDNIKSLDSSLEKNRNLLKIDIVGCGNFLGNCYSDGQKQKISEEINKLAENAKGYEKRNYILSGIYEFRNSNTIIDSINDNHIRIISSIFDDKDVKLSLLNLGSYSYVTDEGIAYLAESLKNNRTLKTLNIESRYATNIGAKLLSSTLDYNLTLEVLNITGRDISQELKEEIKYKLQRNNSIRKGMKKTAFWVSTKGKNDSPFFSSIPDDIKLKIIGSSVENSNEKTDILAKEFFDDYTRCYSKMRI